VELYFHSPIRLHVVVLKLVHGYVVMAWYLVKPRGNYVMRCVCVKLSVTFRGRRPVHMSLLGRNGHNSQFVLGIYWKGVWVGGYQNRFGCKRKLPNFVARID